MKKETWKPVVGYEGLYEVSDLGRVRSLDREVVYPSGNIWNFKGRLMSINHDTTGRCTVKLTRKRKSKRVQVHVLVAEAFIGERPEGYHVCHINGDYLNNNVRNIRYDTASQNRIDIYRYGSKNHNGKLSIEQVLEIRKLYKTGNYSQAGLARDYGITSSTMNSLVNRKTYKWLNEDGTIDESETEIKCR